MCIRPFARVHATSIPHKVDKRLATPNPIDSASASCIVVVRSRIDRISKWSDLVLGLSSDSMDSRGEDHIGRKHRISRRHFDGLALPPFAYHTQLRTVSRTKIQIAQQVPSQKLSWVRAFVLVTMSSKMYSRPRESTVPRHLQYQDKLSRRERLRLGSRAFNLA
jgi:hypothetical protein